MGISIEGFYAGQEARYDSAMKMCESLRVSVTYPNVVAYVKDHVTLYGSTMNMNEFMNVIGKCKAVTCLTLSGFEEVSITDEIQIPAQIEFVFFLYSTKKATDAFYDIVCKKRAWTATQDRAHQNQDLPYRVTFMQPAMSDAKVKK